VMNQQYITYAQGRFDLPPEPVHYHGLLNNPYAACGPAWWCSRTRRPTLSPWPGPARGRKASASSACRWPNDFASWQGDVCCSIDSRGKITRQQPPVGGAASPRCRPRRSPRR
jgi:hypothetical protein